MKTFLIALALALTTATAATAADFDNTAVNLTLVGGAMSFGLETVAGDATALTVGTYVLPHTLMGADAHVNLDAKYGIVSEELTFSAAYALSKNFNALTVYADAEAAYTVASGSTDGGWTATPTVGASYDLNANMYTFGEVSYSWNVSDNWKRAGGALEVGLGYALSDSVVLVPSLVRTFDTGADSTNIKLETVIRF
jgi:hypothetical protein